MKKIFDLLCVLFVLFVTSCQQEEMTYSCNSDENAWVKQNLSEIRSMTREDWIHTVQNLKLPVYRAFTTDQKQEFWKLKIQGVMADYKWGEDEYSHLEKCYKAISENENWFIANVKIDENTSEAFEIFMFKWIAYAVDELKWSNELIAAIIASGEEIGIDSKRKPYLKLNANVARKVKTRTELDCDCNSNNVVFTMCATSKCNAGICKETEDGCGAFYRDKCDGLCMY